jgi:nitrogen fixation-related uncharacterized protein
MTVIALIIVVSAVVTLAVVGALVLYFGMKRAPYDPNEREDRHDR